MKYVFDRLRHYVKEPNIISIQETVKFLSNTRVYKYKIIYIYNCTSFIMILRLASVITIINIITVVFVVFAKLFTDRDVLEL